MIDRPVSFLGGLFFLRVFTWNGLMVFSEWSDATELKDEMVHLEGWIW
jgi:hypothetical protein